MPRRPGRLGERRTIEHTGDISGGAAAGRAMEGDSAAGGVVLGGSLGDTLHRGRAAGGAYQRLLVPIRSDEDQRFRRPVLLDAPASHSLPFRWGLVARNWLTPHVLEIYRSRIERATVARSSAHTEQAE